MDDRPLKHPGQSAIVPQPADVLGPVQLVLVGLEGSDVPAELRARIQELRAGDAVEIMDALFVRKSRNGVLETEPVTKMDLDNRAEAGQVIEAMLGMASAARTTGRAEWPGTSHLFRGEIPPDARRQIPAGTTVLALLLEHRWAIGLCETAGDQGAFPVSTCWIGRALLKDVGLLAHGGR